MGKNFSCSGEKYNGGCFMFWIGLLIGLILGCNISLILYAIILTGKESDKNMVDYLSSDF